MSPLRQRMIDEMTLRGMSPRTHESYLGAVYGLARHYKQSPDQLSIEQVRDYLLHLERERHLSWNSLNVAVSGLRFFYFQTLGWEQTRMDIPPRKTPTRLPEVLSPEEVEQLLTAVDDVKHRTILTTIYAAGLRITEALNLRVRHIDSARMMIRVEQGKGKKDRYTILSPRLLDELRGYLETVPHPGTPVYRNASGPSSGRDCGPESLWPRERACGDSQTNQRPHPSSLLRHSSVGDGRRCPHDPGSDGSYRSANDVAVQIRQHYVGACASKFDLLALPPKLPPV